MSSPQTGYDVQGEQSPAERQGAALRTLVRELGASAAVYLESCVHCGQCAESCHFYVQTGDPRYTPIWKLELMRRTYRREVGPFAPLFRLLDRSVTADELGQWQELLYDSCTLCGRCTLGCPMGIDIAALVEQARHALYRAELLPARLAEITRNAESRHSPFGTPEQFVAAIREIERRFGIELPLDRPRADFLVTVAPGELETHHASIVAIAKVLARIGASWTLASDAFEATNFGLLSGNQRLQRELTQRILDKAVAIGAHTLLLPECGHAYTAARWEAADAYAEPPPVRVLHVAEFLAELIETGRIRVGRIGETATFHDPCQLVRRGGAERAPRTVLAALGLELRELRDHGSFAYCCGGGGGVLANTRARALRQKAFELKRAQVDETGARHFVTSCGQCRLAFERGASATHWDKQPESLLELVADQLVP